MENFPLLEFWYKKMLANDNGCLLEYMKNRPKCIFWSIKKMFIDKNNAVKITYLILKLFIQMNFL